MRLRRVVAGLLIAIPAPSPAERIDGPTPGLVGLVSPARVAADPPGCLRVDIRGQLPLRTGPGTHHPRIGHLQFRPWREASGECDEAPPHFAPEGNATSRPVPTLERGYEEPALLLLERRREWLRIDLGEGSAWLFRPTGYTVEPYPELLAGKLAFATEAWTGELCDSAGERCRTVAHTPAQPVQMLSTQGSGKNQWIEVELTTDACTGGDPVRLDRGWIRSHDDSGRPTVWFHSRGC
jgi:hypothetical protein